MRQVVVLGGSGFVGSQVCREALKHGCKVVSISRRGNPSWKDAWMSEVEWVSSDLESPNDAAKAAINASSSAISCVGAFGSQEFMKRVCGDLTIKAAELAKDAHLKHFSFVSAASYGPILERTALKGYFEGKRAAEERIKELFGEEHCTIARPGPVYGPRRVGGISIPLQLLLAPQQYIPHYLPSIFKKVPIIGDVLSVPSVPVELVARIVTAHLYSTEVQSRPNFPRITGVLEPLDLQHFQQERAVPVPHPLE